MANASTLATDDKPSNDGDTVVSTTSNLRSTSVYVEVADAPSDGFAMVCAIVLSVAMLIVNNGWTHCHTKVNRLDNRPYPAAAS